MKEVVPNTNLVAYCGLYCGACRVYLQDRCPGCHDNDKATWCKIRSCCMQQKIASCADCKDFPEPNDCKKFNNFISRMFGLLFRSDRSACIKEIRQLGIQGHANLMAEKKQHTIKK